jgi:hypothetical protein
MIRSHSAGTNCGAVPTNLILMHPKEPSQSGMCHQPTMVRTILVIQGVQFDSVLDCDREACKVLDLL